MFYRFMYLALCTAYKEVLRDLVAKAIDNPESEVDDIALKIMDSLFNYEG